MSNQEFVFAYVQLFMWTGVGLAVIGILFLILEFKFSGLRAKPQLSPIECLPFEQRPLITNAEKQDD